MFFDADILVEERCIAELLRTVSSPQIRAAYARPLPLKRDNQTLVEKALNLYDTSATIFTERRHLHGRAFAVKEWMIPETDPLLLADDIYLSCHLLHKHGAEGIAASPDAVVYFHQISTVADFYRAYKRRNIEMQKCLRLFPHFRSLPAEQLNRRIVWSKFANESLARMFLWFFLLSLRGYCKVRLALESDLFRKHSAWEITHTSKQSL
jgi:hypothetical protein